MSIAALPTPNWEKENKQRVADRIPHPCRLMLISRPGSVGCSAGIMAGQVKIERMQKDIGDRRVPEKERA